MLGQTRGVFRFFLSGSSCKASTMTKPVVSALLHSDDGFDVGSQLGHTDRSEVLAASKGVV